MKPARRAGFWLLVIAVVIVGGIWLEAEVSRGLFATWGTPPL